MSPRGHEIGYELGDLVYVQQQHGEVRVYDPGAGPDDEWRRCRRDEPELDVTC